MFFQVQETEASKLNLLLKVESFYTKSTVNMFYPLQFSFILCINISSNTCLFIKLQANISESSSKLFYYFNFVIESVS